MSNITVSELASAGFQNFAAGLILAAGKIFNINFNINKNDLIEILNR